MEAKILSLNASHPAPLAWEGKSVDTAIVRAPVPGPLVVHLDHIEGASYGVPAIHGVEHSVLYAFGLESALSFARLVGLDRYEPGLLGENVTLDALDEARVSTGDIFEFGEVLAQAVYPRIPCNRVNFRLQRPDAQKALQDCGRSGIYFRILRPGRIHRQSRVRLVEETPHRFPILELYRTMLEKRPFDEPEMRRALDNGAFPRKMLERWSALLAGEVPV